MARKDTEKKKRGQSLQYDPLSELIAPPPDETPEARGIRLEQEAEAKAISDQIDEEIRQERQAIQVKATNGGVVRILLLGQSESGKSTLQRQFTLVHAPHTFNAERPGWRLVIFLNVVRSIQKILNTLNDIVSEGVTNNTSSEPGPSRPTKSAADTSGPKTSADFVREMTLKLSPVTNLEEAIVSRLLGPDELEVSKRLKGPSSTQGPGMVTGGGLYGVLEGREQEFFIRPYSAWRGGGLLGKIKRGVGRMAGTGVPGDDDGVDWEDRGEPGRILQMCGSDLQTLWNNPWVRSQLSKKRVRIEESPGFFLDDLARITTPRYIPDDSDILRARIKTVGVSEHVFAKDQYGLEWRLYDVGGSRTQRQAWAPFFDHVSTIIFLAPLSPFDTPLAEDKRVNALEDSLLIWRELCSSKILANVPLVLFLNKSDLLKKKLDSGIKVANYVVSFGERPNTYEAAEKYFRAKFEAIRKQHSPPGRHVFVHVTTCVDRKTTSAVISNVQDVLMQQNLKKSSLL